MTTGDSEPDRHTLLADGSLELFADPRLATDADRWIPHFPPAAHHRPRASGIPGRIDLLHTSRPLPPPPSVPPTFRLASIRTWIDEGTARAHLRGLDDRAGGEIDLRQRRARLHAPLPDPTMDPGGMEVFTLLTISSALLLGRMGYALLHAAAPIDTYGRAWLLIGDTHAGKSTTTLNLIRAGHRYLSDDHVVVRADTEGGALRVEGWPRTFHVDAGWEGGQVTGERVDFDSAVLPPDRRVREAPLGGLLFPRVVPTATTEIAPLTAATALAQLVRQSPWFVADRAIAPQILGLLQRVASLPACRLTLGLDSYASPETLSAALAPLLRQ